MAERLATHPFQSFNGGSVIIAQALSEFVGERWVLDLGCDEASRRLERGGAPQWTNDRLEPIQPLAQAPRYERGRLVLHL